MDLNELFTALTAADKAAAEASPYRAVKERSGQLSDLVVQGSPGRDLDDVFASALVTGLLEGVSINLDESYRTGQAEKTRDLLADAIIGKTLSKPSGMSPSVFSTVRDAGTLFRAERELEQQDEQRELRNKIIGAYAGEVIKNPYKAKKARQALRSIFGESGAEMRPDKAEAGRTSRLEELMEEYGDEDLARAAMKREMEEPEKLESRLQGLRKEFQGLPEVRSFVSSDIGYESLRRAIDDPASTSDLELVRGAIQAIEPGMAVREGEQAAVYQSQSIPDAWRGTLSKTLRGESVLSDDVRAGILRIAQRRYNEYAVKFNEAKSFYEEEATRQGLPNPKAITYLGDASFAEYSAPPRRLEKIIDENTRVVDGVTYKLQPNGDWHEVK